MTFILCHFDAYPSAKCHSVECRSGEGYSAVCQFKQCKSHDVIMKNAVLMNIILLNVILLSGMLSAKYHLQNVILFIAVSLSKTTVCPSAKFNSPANLRPSSQVIYQLHHRC